VSRRPSDSHTLGCGVGRATCSDSGLDIVSNSGLEDDRVTDLYGIAKLGGQECRREVWLHVQTVSCDDGRLDPAQDQDLSERKRLCSAHGPAKGPWLFGVDISCGRLPVFLCPDKGAKDQSRDSSFLIHNLCGLTTILIEGDVYKRP